MPEIKKIVVTKGGKVNLGDYQNADRSVTVEAELRPGEDEFEAFDYVSQKAREWLALEIRELVENQLNAADLMGADKDTVSRRVRYSKGFAYLHSVDPEAADILVADMVDDLVTNTAPEVILVSDDPLSPDYDGGSIDDDEDEFDDEPAYDDDWDEDDSIDDDEPEFDGDVDDANSDFDDLDDDDEDTLEEVVSKVTPSEDPTASLPEGADTPNAGFN